MFTSYQPSIQQIGQQLNIITQNVKNLSFRSKILAVFAALGGISCIGSMARIAIIIYRRKRCKYPPGFLGVPFFGSYFTMNMLSANYYHKVLPSCGPIVHVPGGLYLNFIVINDRNLLKSLYQLVIDRPAVLVEMNEVTGADVASANEDENWSQRRKLIMHGLANILDKKVVEEKMNQIMRDITFASLDDKIKQAKLENKLNDGRYYLWYPRRETRNAIFNIIFFAIFGLILKPNDTKFEQYQKQITKLNESFIFAFLAKIFPKILVLLVPMLRNARKILTKQTKANVKLALPDYFEAKKRLLHKYINRHKSITDEAFMAKECQTLFEKVYFVSMIRGANTNCNVDYNDVGDGLDQGNYNYNNVEKITNGMNIVEQRIVSDILILFSGGMDTTSITAERSILLLAKYPKVQQNVYNVCSTMYT